MLSESKNRNAQLYIDNQSKNELFNSELKDGNRIRQSSSLRQMTWVPNNSQSNNAWMASENTFLTNVNSISALDPVVQAYVDHQIKEEFSKLIKPYSDSFNKLKDLFEKHQNENQISFTNFNECQNTIHDKYLQVELQLTKIDNINSENEKLKNGIKENNNQVILLEELIKSLEEKLNNIESSQNKQELKKEAMDLIKDFQSQITSVNESTVKCISHLQDKINDYSDTLKASETKIADKFSSFLKENEIKIKDMKESIENLNKEFNKKICETYLKIEKLNQIFNDREKLFDKYALKNTLNEVQNTVKAEFEQNTLSHNQMQKDFKIEIAKLKEDIEKRQKNSTKQEQESQTIENQKISNENTEKIQNLDIQIQALNKKIQNLEKANQDFNLLPTTISLIQDRVLNINKEEIFFESQIKNIENDIQKIKLKLSKLDRFTLVTFQSTVDLIGTETKGQFDLTIGEPDISMGRSGIHLFLPKTYQDYTFHSSSCQIFEPLLKEPIEPKSSRRKQKNRKLKK